MAEYAFDVKLFATVRIDAENEKDARLILENVLTAWQLTDETVAGINSVVDGGSIVETPILAPDDSVYEDGAELIEVDGESPDERVYP